jgi:hypothetical protein
MASCFLAALEIMRLMGKRGSSELRNGVIVIDSLDVVVDVRILKNRRTSNPSLQPCAFCETLRCLCLFTDNFMRECSISTTPSRKYEEGRAGVVALCSKPLPMATKHVPH